MNSTRTPIKLWHNRIAFALSVLAILLLAISGPGTRNGLWSLRVGVGLFAGAMLFGLAAAGAAIVGLALSSLRTRGTPILAAALVLGAASAAVPLDYVRRVKTLPYINDITTDTEHPPRLSPPKPYPDYFAELQQIGYPELHPLDLALPPRQAFARAAEAARSFGWEFTALDESAGTIDAVATTRWFGFKDDVEVRISTAGSGSRVDMRSKSRIGRSDAGANAARIRDFFQALQSTQPK